MSLREAQMTSEQASVVRPPLVEGIEVVVIVVSVVAVLD